MRRCIPVSALVCIVVLWGRVGLSADSGQPNQRQMVLDAMRQRPNDLWPRGDGHAVIGEPGGPLSQKGYHEPGGSFTPSPGSFGFSIWVKDDQDAVVATSDTIPMDGIQEQYVFNEGAKIPSIVDTTPYYVCKWSYVEAGRWQLDFKNTSGRKLELVFRSVGPAGGPLETVIWDKSRLLLNRRWIAIPGARPSRVVLGNEATGDLRSNKPEELPPVSDTGWCFARLAVSQPETTLQLIDTKPQFASALSYQQTVPQFTFQVPDKRFEESLKAQVATLMMGYIGRQTGPGEPINYPLAWERDGAYSLMAMAKCGQLQTARELSVYFAENDYFGGFGAEGDAPGSAANALIELACLFNDPQYFQWLWPHIVRKMALIDEMANAKGALHKEYVGPLVPYLMADARRHQQIAQAARDGLIEGSMDLHFPTLYITAISHRGLIQAARLATTLGKTAEASDWKAKADKLRTAWVAAFGSKKYDNERNFMIAVWPSWIVNKDFKPFVDAIEARRASEWENGQLKKRPLWTYFNVSQAHQWLFLGRPERTWETLNYFFGHQCAPGLYTYWEGNGEENSFKQWEHYRGWLKPRYVTPHYWTASEMLHVQLDMLAYVDESGAEPVLVVGGGVPREWAGQSMKVKGFHTKIGRVDWQYTGDNKMVVDFYTKGQYTVRPGPGFDKNIEVTVKYHQEDGKDKN